VRRRGKALEVVLHHLVEVLVLGEQVRQLVELGLLGQVAAGEQVRGLDEGRLLRELFDGNPAVAKDALFPVDEGDSALA
jgi:hypothetical protein